MLDTNRLGESLLWAIEFALFGVVNIRQKQGSTEARGYDSSDRRHDLPVDVFAGF